MIISILVILSAIFKAKEIQLNKIFKAGGLMLVIAITTLSSLGTIKTYAATADVEIKFYNNTLVEGKKNVIISLNNKAREIKKNAIKTYNSNITDIVKTNGTSLADTENIKTGDIVKVKEDSYKVILYGDSNSDGTICDTDDIMTIVNDYLGTNKLTQENKIAANISNNDELLDTDDIMQMIQVYLGQKTQVALNIPTGNIDETPEPEETNKKLAEVAKVGDYVNYPVEYTNTYSLSGTAGSRTINECKPTDTGWRVLSNDGDNVRLVMAGCSRLFGIKQAITRDTHLGNGHYYLDDMLNTELAERVEFSPSEEDYASLADKDKEWLVKQGCFIFQGNEISINLALCIKPATGEGFIVSDYTNLECNVFEIDSEGEYSVYGGYTSSGEPIKYTKFGVKPVVTIKADVLTSGKDTNGVWQLITK